MSVQQGSCGLIVGGDGNGGGGGYIQTGAAQLVDDFTTGGAATVLSVTMTTAASSRYILTATLACFSNVADSVIALRFKIDGVTVPATSRATATGQFIALATQFTSDVLIGGAHTFELEAEGFGGTTLLIWPVTFPLFMGANLLVQEVSV